MYVDCILQEGLEDRNWHLHILSDHSSYSHCVLISTHCQAFIQPDVIVDCGIGTTF
jgi:hypothetical protein